MKPFLNKVFSRILGRTGDSPPVEYTFTPDFEPHPDLQQEIDDYTNAAIVWAKKFEANFDFSEESIQKLEEILDILYKNKPRNLKEKDVWDFAILLGCYLGEALRHNLGGEWGFGSMGDGKTLTLKFPCNSLCWPVMRVKRRLDNGYEDNVWHYYLYMMENYKDKDGVN